MGSFQEDTYPSRQGDRMIGTDICTSRQRRRTAKEAHSKVGVKHGGIRGSVGK